MLGLIPGKQDLSIPMKTSSRLHNASGYPGFKTTVSVSNVLSPSFRNGVFARADAVVGRKPV
jgi:hypothetical protein